MINIAKYIKGALTASDEIKAIVADKVYFILSPNNIPTPFITFEYKVDCAPSDKDTMLYDVASVDVFAVAAKPSDMLTLTDAIRYVLDGYSNDHVEYCTIQSVDFEVTDDGLYVSRSNYSLTTNK